MPNMSTHLYGELISRPVPATKTGQAPSRQYRVTPSVLNILAVYLVSLPGLGSAVGSGVTCSSPWNKKGMVLPFVLSTNTKQASPRGSAFMLTSGKVGQLLAQP